MFVVSANRSCLEVHLESIDAKFCTFLATFILHCIAFNNDLNIKKRFMTCALSCLQQSRFYPQGGRRQQGAGWANSSHCRKILSLYSIQQWVNIKTLLSAVVCFRPLWHKCKWCDLALFSVSSGGGSVEKKQYMNTKHGLRLILLAISEKTKGFASDTRYLLPTVLLYFC